MFSLTVTVFKNMIVAHRFSQEAAMCVRAMLLHGDDKYSTYLNFFFIVNMALWVGDTWTIEFHIVDNIVTGSGDETVSLCAVFSAVLVCAKDVCGLCSYYCAVMRSAFIITRQHT